MARYGIMLGRKPEKGKSLVETKPPQSDECNFCNHGKSPCGKLVQVDKMITRGAFSWNPAWNITLNCTMEKGHKGPHIACAPGINEHSLKVWET